MKEVCAIDLETKGLIKNGEPPEILCYSWASANSSGVAAWDEDGKRLLSKLIEQYIIVFHNSSFDNAVLYYYGLPVHEYHDTQLMSYVMYPNANHFHSLAYWGGILDYPKLKKPWEGEYPEEYTPELKEYCLVDAKLTLALYWYLQAELQKDEKAWKFYNEVELPFSLVIQEMERTGMYVDTSTMGELNNTITTELNELAEVFNQYSELCPGEIVKYKKEHPELEHPKYVFIGEQNGEWLYQKYVPFNPNSNKHKEYILRRVAGWEPTTKTKSGDAQVSMDVIEKIDHPIADALVTHAKLTKIQSSFITPFTTYMDDRSVLRGNFNQSVTITGRLSSSNPNLQNIPARGKLGKQMRNLVTVPNSDTVLFNGDLSNIEARVLAWMLAYFLDEFQLADIFISGADFHSSNAENWGVDRDAAKTLLFAILYGAQAPMIAKKLKRYVREAEVLIARLNHALPAVQQLKELVWNCARENGGVLHTILGHRLVYPDLCSNNKWKKIRAERQIFNAYIQGSAGDIFKELILQSMPSIVEYDAELAACVHDEALGYVPVSNAEPLCHKLTNIFSSCQLIAPVPISADFKYGTHWGDLKAA